MAGPTSSAVVAVVATVSSAGTVVAADDEGGGSSPTVELGSGSGAATVEVVGESAKVVAASVETGASVETRVSADVAVAVVEVALVAAVVAAVVVVGSDESLPQAARVEATTSRILICRNLMIKRRPVPGSVSQPYPMLFSPGRCR